MEPITYFQNEIINEFSEFIIKYEHYESSLANTKGLSKKEIEEHNEALKWTQIEINDCPAQTMDFDHLFDRLKLEFDYNIKLPVSIDIKKKYLRTLLVDLETIQDDFESDGDWRRESLHPRKRCKFIDFEPFDLNDNELDNIEDYFERIASFLKEYIEFIKIVRTNLPDIQLEIEALFGEEYEEKYLLGDNLVLPFKKIQLNDPTNVIATLFYDLLKKDYIASGKTNLENFIVNCFIDENKESLSASTIKTYLKDNKETKRALEDVRIPVPNKKDHL